MREPVSIIRQGAITLAALLVATGAAADQSGFIEDFATLDRDRWYLSDGWVNGPHQSCLWSADAVRVQDGVLELSLEQATDGPEDYLCAEIQSVEQFGFGVYEARLRIPFAAGTNSNFFSYIGPTQGQLHNEIDFEFIARDGPTLQTNTYVDGTGGNEALIPVHEDEWHDIAFAWEPGQLRWYLDGELIRTETGDTVPALAQKIYLSIWSTAVLTDWLGHFEWDGPLRLQVERVAYTPPGAACLFTESITCNDESPESGD